MRALIVENVELSPSFDVANGTKQGRPCFGSTLVHNLFHDAADSIQRLHDGDVFDARRRQAKTKVKLAILRDLLFADDCVNVNVNVNVDLYSA